MNPIRRGLRGRVTLLGEFTQIAKRIRRSWNVLEPEALAEEIIALEDRVQQIEGTSPEIEKVRKLAEDLHFQFVFPIAMEVIGPFAREVHKIAQQIVRTHSVYPFNQLNEVQRHETQRAAGAA